ncbi:hypothetical protein [Nonomuraea sp. NPDC005501]|uniref:hypothetical protein n=1 Tax=Nonomuraea sp. NPDC005501 TaxID=3156884 RepID=UPI0033AD8D9A
MWAYSAGWSDGNRIETEIGLLLELDHGEVRILNLADELVVTDTALPDAVEATLR